MSAVLGLDGCRGGWIGALVEGDQVGWLRLPDIRAALVLDVASVGVDMPLGLPETGRRECDVLAKRELGRAHPRVFLAPPRGVLAASTYALARPLHRDLTGGLGMSAQTWGLVAKIREVDAHADDPRLVEVHPELSFALLAGRVLASKHAAAGLEERRRALQQWLPGLEEVPWGDDGLDALVVAWSATRWLAGSARTLPADPPVDACGRPMRIVT